MSSIARLIGPGASDRRSTTARSGRRSRGKRALDRFVTEAMPWGCSARVMVVNWQLQLQGQITLKFLSTRTIH